MQTLKRSIIESTVQWIIGILIGYAVLVWLVLPLINFVGWTTDFGLLEWWQILAIQPIFATVKWFKLLLIRRWFARGD